MAEVQVNINNRTYGIACDDGQEDRLTYLSKQVDQKVREIAQAGGATSEAHLLVLASLMIGDEALDLQEHIEYMARQIKDLQIQNRDLVAQVRSHAATPKPAAAAAPAPAAPPQYAGLPPEDEKLVLQAIDSLKNRIETVASRLQDA